MLNQLLVITSEIQYVHSRGNIKSGITEHLLLPERSHVSDIRLCFSLFNVNISLLYCQYHIKFLFDIKKIKAMLIYQVL